MWIERRLPPVSPRPASPSRGGALLAVLWLSAALSAIAFAVASSVRGETERTATAAETVRAYYLAAAGIERALLYMQWGTPRYWEPWMPSLTFLFPSGVAVVEIVPETARLDINSARPEDLYRLLIALGTEPGRAHEVTLGIVDWRTAAPPGNLSPFDAYYMSLAPSFQARHASFEETEEVLLVKGMTPDLYYGSQERDAQGRWFARGGLKDCISVHGSTAQFDVNTAHPALLASAGLSPETVAVIVAARRLAPFRTPAQVAGLIPPGMPGAGRLRVGGNSIYTLRSTARLALAGGRLSDLRRTVAAKVKTQAMGYEPPYQVLRWYDNPGLDTAGAQ